MTKLGPPVPTPIAQIRAIVTKVCRKHGYKVIDAGSQVTGRDYLLKIWRFIAATPLSVGVCHEELPESTQANIYYEIGVAQAMGKETMLIKSPRVALPSDFVRTEYVEFNDYFEGEFSKYMASLAEQAGRYKTVAEQLENNPALVADYLKRAYLITGDKRLRKKARRVITDAALDGRARNSVELLAAEF